MSRVHVTDNVADLLRQVRGGSQEALGVVYERYGAMVHHVALGLTASPAEAEDVLQDVFIGLRDSLNRYEHRDQFGAWLKRVTVRTTLMRLRAARRRREAPLDAVRPADLVTGEQHAVERVAVVRALAELPGRLRIVFVLKEIEGYDHREIGTMLGIRPGTSEVRLHRAWARLRRILGEGRVTGELEGEP